MRYTRLSATIAATLLLAGCANTTFHIPFFGKDDKAKESEYAKSRQEIKNQSLEVPPDLSAPDTNTNFAIPGMDTRLSTEGKKVLQSGTVLPKFTKVRMESAGDVRWLVVNAAPEVVWPLARQFWIDQGFALSKDDPTAGLLETNWLEEHPEVPGSFIHSWFSRTLGSTYSSGRIDQYGMRLERGTEPDSTEIYITHRGMDEVYVDAQNKDSRAVRWLERKPQPEREAAELKLLLVRLGVNAEIAGEVLDTAPKQVASAGVDTAAGEAKANGSPVLDRATLITPADGKRFIQLHESFDRAWRRVGQALERAGYTINDRDRSLGIYYVRPSDFVAAKDDPSFWRKLEFWKSDEDKKKSTDSKGPEYIVIVAGKDPETTVRVGTRDGSQLAEVPSTNLLKSLVGELR